MRLAIMQPYFMPYVGYFQLINAVDTFVFLDDVNYINKGWINRNNILVNDKAHMFTLPLNKASQNLLINEINLADDIKWQQKLLRTFEMAYRRAPNFENVFPLVAECVQFTDKNLSRYIGYSLKVISSYLSIETTFIYSSEIEKNANKKGQDRIIDICTALGTNMYINAIGGTELYDKDIFEKKGLHLYFLVTLNLEYRQFGNNFVPWLSIIDILMFESVEEIKNKLKAMILK